MTPGGAAQAQATPRNHSRLDDLTAYFAMRLVILVRTLSDHVSDNINLCSRDEEFELNYPDHQ